MCIRDRYCADNQEFVDNTDYASETVEVNSIALLSNPIDYKVKKPVVWYQLVRLMKSADAKVKIHTPYIICNDYMYEGLTEVCDKVENVSLMTNSIGKMCIRDRYKKEVSGDTVYIFA